ncbi:MAG: DNA cytosine methyltransferase, partial [Spiribacter salinus]
MAVYYNDADPAACAWLRELISAGLLPDGEVDARSILDVEPADLRGFTQCHFFAGIGGWPYALRLAGIAGDLSVWTGSPPCQPFSQAGQRKGQDDDRHLAPAFLQLVAACRPELVFGEQVASAAVLGKAMSGMRKAEADRLIQKAQQRWLPARLQRLRERIREEKADGARRGGAQAGICEATPANTQGARVDSGRETQGEGKGVGLFAELEGNSGTNRRGLLRSDWDTVRFDLAESVERSVPGSDCSGRGVYAGKHQGGALRAEHDGERLGVAGRDAGCGGAPAETLIGYISRNIDEADAELEETAQWAWIDHVFVQLERAGYACGACSSPACSAGA